MSPTPDEQFRQLGLAVIDTECNEIARLRSRIDEHFAAACRILANCKARVVVTGMGKSGHIGGKIAATLASTGTPAFFVHPGEASHGDLGMITAGDVVLALSNSGETSEILTIVPLIKRLGVPVIGMTGNPASTLATEAAVNLDVSVSQEACPHDLAPTSSTTAALVMGDALAIALLDARGFTPEDFARSHPGGSLGRKLLLHVADIMHGGAEIPRVEDNATIGQALIEMTNKGLGMTAITDAHGRLRGIYTDGDLRRTFESDLDLKSTPVTEVMTAGGITIDSDALAAEGLNLMERHKINSLLVVDAEHRVVGAFNMHDLLRAGVV